MKKVIVICFVVLAAVIGFTLWRGKKKSSKTEETVLGI